MSPSPVEIDQRITDILIFLGQHKGLWSCHVVEFFSNALWDNIDHSWLQTLKSIRTEALLCVPSGYYEEDWPESLITFISTARKLSLDRSHKKSESDDNVSSVLLQGMNSKKKHEVSQLSHCVSELAKQSNADFVVDFGSGQGYLSNVLSFHHGLRVVAIDNRPHNSNVTRQRAIKFEKYFRKEQNRRHFPAGSSSDFLPPVTLTQHIDLSLAQRSDLASLLLGLNLNKAVATGSKQLADSKLKPDNTVECNCAELAETRKFDSRTLNDHFTSGQDSSLSGKFSCKVEPRETSSGIMEHTDAPRISSRNSSSSSGMAQASGIEPGSCSACTKAEGVENCVASGDWVANLRGNSAAKSLLLVGLHACGDLSVNLIRTFLNNSSVRSMVSVGCCYNLLSEGESRSKSERHEHGFPVSSAVKSASLFLGKNGRDLACQSPEKWKDVGCDAAAKNFEYHGFRAGFELVTKTHYPNLAGGKVVVGRLGKASRRKEHCSLQSSPDETSLGSPSPSSMESRFLEYCRTAFQRIDVKAVSQQEILEKWKIAKGKMELIGPFWTLRAVLAPVLETLILLDRVKFMQEASHSSGTKVEVKLFPLFDSALSPRNMALVATKSL